MVHFVINLSYQEPNYLNQETILFMAKSKKRIKKPDFEKEYQSIMKSYLNSIPVNQPQVVSPTDNFIKFSLYIQSPVSITSPNTTEVF